MGSLQKPLENHAQEACGTHAPMSDSQGVLQLGSARTRPRVSFWNDQEPHRQLKAQLYLCEAREVRKWSMSWRFLGGFRAATLLVQTLFAVAVLSGFVLLGGTTSRCIGGSQC